MRGRVMSRGTTLAALAVAGLVLRAQADEPRASGVPERIAGEVSARAVEHGVPVSSALAPVAEAAARGAPVELVAAKVLEGLSKGVPLERVTLVARQLTDWLVLARAVLDDARRAGLAPPVDRAGAQADLATAFASGVGRAQTDALVKAAREGHGGAEGVTSAAFAMGELARRGVPPADALGLGLAIARHGSRPPAEIAGLFDAWRAEGGKDPHPFLDEAARRIERGRALDGMVDVFGESPDHVASDRGHGDATRRSARDGLADAESVHHGRADKGVVPGAGRGKDNPGKKQGR